MNLPVLHVIATDAVAESPSFLDTAEDLITACRERMALHLRLRTVSARTLFDFARRLADTAAAAGAWCVVNGRVDVALASGAQCVQLGSGALPVDTVRSLSGARLAIGASVHSAEEARRQVARGADFLLAGSVFHTASHPERLPAGPALVASCAAAGAPVVGIGGIDTGNAGRVMEAGAAGIAVVRAVWTASAPVDAALRLADRARRTDDTTGASP